MLIKLCSHNCKWSKNVVHPDCPSALEGRKLMHHQPTIDLHKLLGRFCGSQLHNLCARLRLGSCLPNLELLTLKAHAVLCSH
jgi:hypothetical protein